MSGGKDAPVLGFLDHHPQRYADRVRVADAGESLIGEHLSAGSLGLGGEFRVDLVELRLCGKRPTLHPRTPCFGDGVGSLGRAIGAGCLDALAPVLNREEFSRRLEAIGMSDRCDRRMDGGGRRRRS